MTISEILETGPKLFLIHTNPSPASTAAPSVRHQAVA